MVASDNLVYYEQMAQVPDRVITDIIFDFDGTLADSFPLFVRTVETVLRRPAFTDREIADMREQSIRETLHRLHIRKWQLPWLIFRGMREIDRHQNEIGPFDGIAKLLQQLKRDGYHVHILSSHSEKGIRAFLNHHDLAGYIDHIYGNVGLFSKSKAIKKLRRRLATSLDHCVFVGDEIRDIEAGQKAGVSCIAVTWGFNSEQSLRQHSPTHLAQSPDELLQIIQTLS